MGLLLCLLIEILSLSRRQCLIIYSFKLFADLAQTHSCIWENLVLWNLFLDDLSKNYLERETKSTLLQILFKHEGLLLALPHVLLCRGVVFFFLIWCWCLCLGRWLRIWRWGHCRCLHHGFSWLIITFRTISIRLYFVHYIFFICLIMKLLRH